MDDKRIKMSSSFIDFTNILLSIINILIIIVYRPISIFSFIYFSFILFVINKLFFGFNIRKLYLSFNIMTIFMMALLFVQMVSFPNYYGLTPSLRGVGADDVFFFSQSTNRFPDNFNIHHRTLFEKSNYSIFLIFLTTPVRYFYNLLPIDLLMVNVISGALIVNLTSEVTLMFTLNEKMKNITYWIVLICPIFIMNGLILIRDGWTATLLIASIYLLFKRKYVRLVLVILLQLYLRVASGIETLIILGIFLYVISISKNIKDKNLKKSSKLILSLLPIISLLLVISYREYFLTKLGDNIFFREDFVDGFLSHSDGSILYRIMNLPFFLRIPIGTIFFLLAPFINFNFYNYDYFIPRNVLSTMFGLINIIYIKYFVNSIIVSLKRKDTFIVASIYSIMISMMLKSQLSIQIRHKTMLMPIYYILVAYGMYSNTKYSKLLGCFAALMLLFVNIITLI